MKQIITVQAYSFSNISLSLAKSDAYQFVTKSENQRGLKINHFDIC